MKKLFLLLASLLATQACLLAADIQVPHITVSGTAITEVVPDQMAWSLQVRIERQNLEEAASEQSKATAEVLNLLKKMKIEDKQVQTSRMEFGENKEYKSNSWVKTGYYAQTDVSFKLMDFSKYEQLWIGLTKISGVSVENTSYDDSKRIEHRKETRQKALEAAKEKAAEMAKVLGSQIQEPLEIEEDSLIYEVWRGNAYQNSNNSAVQPGGNRDLGDDAPIALGTIPIEVRVKVSFHLLTNQK